MSETDRKKIIISTRGIVLWEGGRQYGGDGGGVWCFECRAFRQEFVIENEPAMPEPTAFGEKS